MASAATPLPAREMSSELIASLTAGAFCRSLSRDASVLCRARTSTTTSSTAIRLRGQDEIEAQNLADCDHRLGYGHGVVADRRAFDLVGAGRDVGDPEVSLDSGHRAEPGLLEEDVRTDEGVSHFAVDDVAGYNTGLCAHFGGPGDGKQGACKQCADYPD